MKIVILFISLTIILSCSNSEKNKTVSKKNEKESMSFTALTSVETSIDFTNTITETDSLNYFNYEYMYTGGGVAVGDINNDGLDDIYFSGNQVSDKLYLNKGNMKFEDITDKAIGKKSNEGWHTGVSMVDINQDGWLDIYVCRSGISNHNEIQENLLYINNKNNTFTEKSKTYNLNSAKKSTQASFFDFDNDGDLDVYILNHPNQDPNQKTKSVGEINDLIKSGSPDTDQFFENVNGKYIDVTQKVGISNHAYGLGVTVSDINNDGFTDVYISNDYMAPDYLYINNGDGTFTDESKKQLKHMSNYAMGNDVSDFNNDGYLDIITVDMVSEDHVRSKKNMGGMSTDKFWQAVYVGYHYQYMFNALQINNGNGTFSEIAQMAGISKTDWSWAPLFVDFDNDGYKDLFISNGYKRDTRDNDYNRESHNPALKNATLQQKLELIPATKIQNYIFKNNGNLHFDKKMKDWNLNHAINSNGAVYADLDNDGDMDLITNNIDEVSTIFRNDLQSNNNYIQIIPTKNNVLLYGTKITIKTSSGNLYQEFQIVRGYQSSVQPLLHFGLGKEKEVEIQIQWPNKSYSILKNVKVNQKLNVDFKKLNKENINKKEAKHFFETLKFNPQIKHAELFVNDFKKEVLLPNKMSQLGPFLSKGDVNNDGLEDFYLSGSRNYSGQLFIQNKNGSFSLKKGPWQNQKQREEMDSKFFDVDNDGDLDLYVLSGSNEYNIRSKMLYDQLYINDGKGNFKNESNRLPFMETSAQRLTVGDYDNDGDLDIFIGGRQTPGFYPLAPRSFLLQNNNGYFTDVTTNSLDIMGPGLITESVFTDFDNDGDLDLICVGEWMPISFYENKKGIFKNVTKKYKLNKEVGWWSSITVGDFNKDGKNDYVIGNVGENNKFHPTQTNPLEIYCYDFDKSGTYDIVLGKKQNNICYPIRGKQCSTEQMPFVSEKFPTYNDFAVADLEKIYGKENLNEAVHYSATNFSSVILLSNSNGFSIKKLPQIAQISPINSGLTIDINNDGNLDFIGVGNNYAAEVETIRYDAGTGVVLLGDGKGNFKGLTNLKSGFFTNTDDKDLIQINNRIIISSNNSYLKQFRIKK